MTGEPKDKLHDEEMIVPFFAETESELERPGSLELDTSKISGDGAEVLPESDEVDIAESAEPATGDEEKLKGEMYMSPEKEKLLAWEEDMDMSAEWTKVVVDATCVEGGDKECGLCCSVFTNPTLRERFGYQEEVAECRCHDICVEDVKLICVERRSITIPIGGLNGLVGCRGGRTITGVPEIDNVRIFCAEEELVQTGPNACRQVNNEVGVEVVLAIQVPAPQNFVYVVHRHIESFTCTFDEFRTFPGGSQLTAEQFEEAIRFIDGSCKTVIIEDFRLVTDDNCPRVEVDLKVIDKLWKHENLLVTAIQPYPEENVTVKQEFNDLHRIGPCDDPCPELL